MTKFSKRNLAIFVLTLLLIIAASLVVAKSIRDPKNVPKHASGTSDEVATQEVNLASLVSYTLPEGWTEVICGEKEDIILFMPPGTAKPGCSGTPNASVKMSIDPHSTLRCDVHESSDNTVTQRTCEQTQINNKPALKLILERQNSKDTAYFTEAGSYVVKIEHTDRFGGAGNVEEGFNLLAKSVISK